MNLEEVKPPSYKPKLKTYTTNNHRKNDKLITNDSQVGTVMVKSNNTQ